MLKYEMDTMEYSESELADVKKWYLIDSTKNKHVCSYSVFLTDKNASFSKVWSLDLFHLWTSFPL